MEIELPVARDGSTIFRMSYEEWKLACIKDGCITHTNDDSVKGDVDGY